MVDVEHTQGGNNTVEVEPSTGITGYEQQIIDTVNDAIAGGQIEAGSGVDFIQLLFTSQSIDLHPYLTFTFNKGDIDKGKDTINERIEALNEQLSLNIPLYETLDSIKDINDYLITLQNETVYNMFWSAMLAGMNYFALSVVACIQNEEGSNLTSDILIRARSTVADWAVYTNETDEGTVNVSVVNGEETYYGQTDTFAKNLPLIIGGSILHTTINVWVNSHD